jgi:hypothetical protein
MNKILGLCLLLLGVQVLWAREGEQILAGYDPTVDIIADNYEAGAYLIYDCVEEHWTCVTEPFFKECEKKRDKDILDNLELSRCAPLGLFPTKKSCFQRQLYLTGHKHATRFCVLPEWQQKDIVFGLK